MKKIVLVTGGTRSGKSFHALKLGEGAANKAFVATATPVDEEMAARIARHREERGSSYLTFEVPYDLSEFLAGQANQFDFVLVDCLTLWISNWLLRDPSVCEKKIDELVLAAGRLDTYAAFVTNEVGLGVVPDHAMGRLFRDLQGRLNQKMAQAADQAVFMVSGLPLSLKNGEYIYGPHHSQP